MVTNEIDKIITLLAYKVQINPKFCGHHTNYKLKSHSDDKYIIKNINIYTKYDEHYKDVRFVRKIQQKLRHYYVYDL